MKRRLNKLKKKHLHIGQINTYRYHHLESEPGYSPQLRLPKKSIKSFMYGPFHTPRVKAYTYI